MCRRYSSRFSCPLIHSNIEEKPLQEKIKSSQSLFENLALRSASVQPWLVPMFSSAVLNSGIASLYATVFKYSTASLPPRVREVLYRSVSLQLSYVCNMARLGRHSCARNTRQ